MNSNGVLSFGDPFAAYSAVPFPLPFRSDVLIAPFWEDVDITVGGQIYYRYSTDLILFDRVRTSVSDAFPSSTFNPGLLFIATWDRVNQFGGDSDSNLV